jgi:hypothetical protein
MNGEYGPAILHQYSVTIPPDFCFGKPSVAASAFTVPPIRLDFMTLRRYGLIGGGVTGS